MSHEQMQKDKEYPKNYQKEYREKRKKAIWQKCSLEPLKTLNFLLLSKYILQT